MIGIGTAHGDDAAGLAVIEALCADGLPDGVETRLCGNPGIDLASALHGANAAVLVDAMRSGAVPGSVERLAADALPRLGALSSHGLGVCEGLALAAALGRSPQRLELIGIEAANARGPGLSPAMRRGVRDATALVRRLAGELASAADA